MKNKLLMAVDIGNTNITCAFFKDEDVVCSFRMTTQLARTSDEYGVFIRESILSNGYKVDDVGDVIIASVVPNIMYSFVNGIKKYLKVTPLVVGH